MKKNLCFCGVAAFALALTACQDTVNTIENSEKSAEIVSMNDRRINSDSFLRRRLELHSVRVTTEASGCMSVQVAATNTRTGFFPELWSHITGENPYPVAYKFDWQDAAGMTVNSHVSGVWKHVEIKPGETYYFNSTAPNEKCKDFVLSLKEDNKNEKQ